MLSVLTAANVNIKAMHILYKTFLKNLFYVFLNSQTSHDFT